MLRARHEAAVVIVTALARAQGALDVAGLVKEIHRALDAEAPQHTLRAAPKPRGKGMALGFGKDFKAFEPEMARERRSITGAWPPTCPARREDIEHSLGDGRRLRCFETGQWVRDLEPTLRARKMTAAQYRQKWGLPRSYPMQSQAELAARQQMMPWLGRKPTATEIAASIGHRTLISFEDGGHYKTLSTHLIARGLTPESYRRKWGLPEDYPMVAEATQRQRTEHGRALGAKNATNLKPRTKGDQRFK